MNDFIYMMDGQLYVPDKGNLHLDAICLYHDTLIAGHPRTEKTLELLQCSYSWPKVANYVKEYVSCCDRCQCFKVEKIALACKLQPLKIPHMPWIDITADFTTDLPISNSFDSILVVID